MFKDQPEIESLIRKSRLSAFGPRPVSLWLIVLSVLLFTSMASAQDDPVNVAPPAPTSFRVSERLTYSVSFGKFKNAAYAETYVVSRGKLEGKDAVELRSRIKTNDFISAAFFLIDNSRTTFASAETGLPLYVRKASNETGLPEEKVENYLTSPTVNYDLLTLIYQIRRVGGIGNFPLFEDEKNYTVSLQNTVSEQVRTVVGDFDTSVSTVASDYLTEKGITNLRINFSQDETRIPVLIRFQNGKGEFRAELASLQFNDDTEPTPVEPTPTPVPVPTPVATPKPVPTPTPYQENQPLSADLPFRLGETLEYRITANGQSFGLATLQARQRTQFRGEDSLLLTARVTGIEPGNPFLNLNDGITAQVNPETLAPQSIELNFTGAFSKYNQTVQFDQRAGTAFFNGKVFPDVPVGTHSILSLAFAIRSFNLRPSKDPTNPVNDTRVAVFLDDRAYVFILRPAAAEIITIDNRKVPAQMISVTTGNPDIDRMNPRLWLSADEQRLPLRLTFGAYQADLLRQSNIFPAK